MVGTRIYHYASIVSTSIVWGTTELHQRGIRLQWIKKEKRKPLTKFIHRRPWNGEERKTEAISHIRPWSGPVMYTVHKSVGCSTVHQAYVALFFFLFFFINILIWIQDTNINPNKQENTEQLKLKCQQQSKLIGNMVTKMILPILGKSVMQNSANL